MKEHVIGDAVMVCVNEDRLVSMIPIAFLIFVIIFYVYWRTE